MDPLPRLALTQALNNAWANHRLLGACMAWSQSDFEARRTGFSPSRRSGVVVKPLTRLLAHLFQRQAHRRGQAHAMPSGTHVAPPQLDDFFCADDAPLRVADFTAFGFSEERIWPRPE